MTADPETIPHVPLNTDAVRHGSQTHGVVKIDANDLSDVEFARFMETLGEPMFTVGETPVDHLPMLNVVTNVGRTTKPKSVFHSDTTYVKNPPSLAALYAVDVPVQGGATLFTDQYRAYDTLAPELKDLLSGATILHSATGVEIPEGEERQARHPVVCRQSGTGRLALYLTTPGRMSELLLADGADRSDLIRQLYEHSQNCGPHLRHAWSKGDIIVWDNRCTLHAADHSNVVGDRTLYRALVRGGAPA